MLIATGLTGSLIIGALCVVPGATLGVYLRMAGFILVYPLLVASVSVPPRELALGLAGAVGLDSRCRDHTPDVLRLLGSLTWAAGLIGILGSFFAYYDANLSIDRVNVAASERASAVPGAIAAMLVPPVFALVVRLVFYDLLANALENAANGAGAGSTAESRLEE